MPEHGQLYFNGIIRTMDPACMAAEAAAVKDGTIIAVGKKSVCKEALGKGYRPVDLKGGALLPGFIDTHLHPTNLVDEAWRHTGTPFNGERIP